MTARADAAAAPTEPAGDPTALSAPQWGAIAQKLRALRLEQQLSVRKLGAVAGVSGSLISAIELGKSRPSIGSLLALCDALGTSIPVLFDETSPGAVPNPGTASPSSSDASSDQTIGRHVQRSRTRGRLELGSGITLERLSQSDDPDADFLLATYAPGAESNTAERLQTHHGKEYGFIQSGELTVTIGAESVRLGPGDSIAFPSTEPHRVANTGDGPAQALWVNLHNPGSAITD